MADKTKDNEALDLELLEQVSGGKKFNTSESLVGEPSLPRKSDYDKTITEIANLVRNYNLPYEVAEKAIQLAKERGITAEQALKLLGY